MKKLLLVAMAVILFVAIACGTKTSEVLPTVTPTPTPEKELFCEEVEIKVVDFGVLNEAKALIEENSVFQGTAKDQATLFNGALESLFAFLSVSPGAIPQWAREIVNEELAGGGKDFSVLNKVYEGLVADPAYREFLQEPSQKKDLIQAAITGFLDTLKDPFASYISPERWISFSVEETAGRYRGTGVTLRTNSKGEIMIDGVMAGAPAEKSGLKIRDVILEVNDKLVKCTIEQFIYKVKSLEDPNLKIKIRREVAADGNVVDKEMIINLRMEEIKLKHVSSYPVVKLPNGRGDTSEGFPYKEAIPEDILYIKMKEFTTQAGEDLRTVLTSLDIRKFSGIIVDLRSNPGGYLNVVSEAVDHFLNEGFILTAEGPLYSIKIYLTQGSLWYEYEGQPQVYDQSDLVPQDIKVAVITGKEPRGQGLDNSYSAAEVFAGALQDNGRAVIVSREERTGGKGLVNGSFPLRNGEYGGLYLGIAKFKTPNGQDIEKQDLDRDGYFEIGGLKPDIQVTWSWEDHQKNGQDVDYDPTLFAAIDYLRGAAK